ncbi:MAG: DNA alkylation repair protein [Lachnospiraceae bacterium]|nr:DNA alkylation repair protein [Lachnospiraceae bacterium]
MTNVCKEIREELFSLQDPGYRDFQGMLIPSNKDASMIGVRTPELRRLARAYAGREDIAEFLDDLPHQYFDENQLHAFIISGIKDYEKCVKEVIRFLPYVDNWATCDQMSPKVFRKHRQELAEQAEEWIGSDHTYTIRFGIKMLMDHFLEEEFDLMYPEMVAQVRSEDYYIRMMVAWYFATALAKQYDAVLPFIENRRLDPWTHNKTIQKAVESYRVTPEHKAYLKSLKIK